MRKDDRVRIQHMLDVAREAMQFASGKTRAHIERDRQLVLALVKEIEIIGEAASKVSDETRSLCSQVPWKDIIGMRNHWDTVAKDMPLLETTLVEAIGRA